MKLIALTTKQKILLYGLFTIVAVLLIGNIAKAESLPADVAEFAPESDAYAWFVRQFNETGRGQTFPTGATTEAIETIGLKLCRKDVFEQPKTLTLCENAENGWYTGCQNPLASKEFSAQEMNDLVPYDVNCHALGDGGDPDGVAFKWTYFNFDTPVSVSSSQDYFFYLGGSGSQDNENSQLLRTMYNNCHYLGSSEDYIYGQTYHYEGATRYQGSGGALCDVFFKVFSTDPVEIPFAITSHETDDPVVYDTWVDVAGTCPADGEDRIGLTNDCLGFPDIEYNVSCVDNQFSGQIYYDGSSDRIIARDIGSQSGDCVDYDEYMDFVTIRGLEIIEGYPDDWYFNFDYYQDYDIKVKSPVFDTAITLPKGTETKDFTFGFIFPASSTESNLNFTIKQYNSAGDVLNESFHAQNLANMADTWNYTVTLSASTTPYHYVVQLTEISEMKRQFPFGVYVSDLDAIVNSDGGFLFPRLVDTLRQKVVFNYYFTFHDGFYDMFNQQSVTANDDALDVTFKSVSADGQYDLDIKIFSASNPIVKSFASKIRPFVTAILWLVFAMYVIFRVTHLFNDNE